MHPRLLTMETRDYEPHIFRWIVDHLPAGGVLFDVGAHYGGLSLRVCRHMGPAGRVVFEPSPVLLEMLRYHQRRNRLRQMTVVGSAGSETDETRATLHLLNGGLSAQFSHHRSARASVPRISRKDHYGGTNSPARHLLRTAVDGARRDQD